MEGFRFHFRENIAYRYRTAGTQRIFEGTNNYVARTRLVFKHILIMLLKIRVHIKFDYVKDYGD